MRLSIAYFGTKLINFSEVGVGGGGGREEEENMLLIYAMLLCFCHILKMYTETTSYMSISLPNREACGDEFVVMAHQCSIQHFKII